MKGSFDSKNVDTINNNTDVIISSKGRYENFNIEFVKSYYDSENRDKMIAEFAVEADNISVGDSVAVDICLYMDE